MKKMMTAVIAGILALTNTAALAYNFPTPDWGKLLQEKTQMVTTESFELYAQAPATSVPYYGARLEPKDGVLFGSVAEYSDCFSQPISAYLTYFDMSIGQEDIYYPANNIIRESNAAVTVGFTVHDINNVNFDQFRRCLDNLASYNKPMFIRFANEMNVSTLGDEPETYKTVFRTAANMIHEYPNFAVVWSPNDMGALDRPFEYYYPGDEYVDWVGVSSYMKRFFQGNINTADKDKKYFMINEYAWHTNAVKPIVKFMQDNNINKPLMISEGGVSYRNKLEADNSWWAVPRIKNMYWNLIMEYPQIKLINYFNVYRADEAEHYDITDNASMVQAVNEALNSGAYKREYDKSADFAFAKANSAGTLNANDGIVKLYTSAYFPNNIDVTVTYRVDGTWYHNSNSIPYTCGLNVAALSEGSHTLEISSNTGAKKSYNFIKSGNAIRFGGEAPTATAPSAPTQKTPKVVIDGVELAFDQNPIIDNGRTLVPMRKIFEVLGAEIEWDGEDYVVTARTADKTIVMGIGNSFFWIGDKKVDLDVPAKIVNGRTLIPLRAVSEALECNVEWNGDTYTATITK